MNVLDTTPLQWGDRTFWVRTAGGVGDTGDTNDTGDTGGTAESGEAGHAGAGHALVPCVGEHPVYDAEMYEYMAGDTVRNEPYRAAVRAAVAGRTVVEIGTGQLALWSIEAARAGARHVWAIEAMPANADAARAAVAAAGLSDRVTVLTGLSTELDLPERVDVCISEIIGCIGGSEGTSAVLADARRRLLRPGAVSVPRRCRTQVAAATLTTVMPGGEPCLAAETLGLVEALYAAHDRAFDFRVCLWGDLDPVLLSATTTVEDLRFDGLPAVEGHDRVELVVERPGRLTGLIMGILLEAGDDVPVIDTLRSPTSWLPVYAPLWLDGVEVAAGDRLEVTFAWALGDDGVHPDYRVDARVHVADGEVTGVWVSRHHGGEPDATPFYRALLGIER